MFAPTRTGANALWVSAVRSVRVPTGPLGLRIRQGETVRLAVAPFACIPLADSEE